MSSRNIASIAINDTKPASVASKEVSNTVAAVTSSSSVRSRHTKILEGFLVIWLDTNIDENSTDFQHSFAKLQKIVQVLELFTNVDECIAYMKNMGRNTIILIISGTLDENILLCIHDITQLHSILVFSENVDRYKERTEKWSKIQNVSASIKDTCESLKKVIRQCDHDVVPISVISKRTTDIIEGSENKNFNQLESSYMYSVRFKEILLEMNEDDTEPVKDLMKYCRQRGVREQQLSKFNNEYGGCTAIWLYTDQDFLFRMLNHALRTLDMETMLKVGFLSGIFIKNWSNYTMTNHVISKNNLLSIVVNDFHQKTLNICLMPKMDLWPSTVSYQPVRTRLWLRCLAQTHYTVVIISSVFCLL